MRVVPNKLEAMLMIFLASNIVKLILLSVQQRFLGAP